MEIVVAVTLGLLAVAALLCLGRALRPGSVADRVVGLDTFLVVVATGIGAGAVLPGGERFLDLVVATSLLAFVGTVTVARFIERRGA